MKNRLHEDTKQFWIIREKILKEQEKTHNIYIYIDDANELPQPEIPCGDSASG